MVEHNDFMDSVPGHEPTWIFPTPADGNKLQAPYGTIETVPGIHPGYTFDLDGQSFVVVEVHEDMSGVVEFRVEACE